MKIEIGWKRCQIKIYVSVIVYVGVIW